MMRAVTGKTQSEINIEWDRIAELRSEQIRTGQDISYKHILVPTVQELTETRSRASVLDVGCGCGFLTEQLAASSIRIVGIDPSERNIALARTNCQHLSNALFLASTIEEFSEVVETPFEMAVANMSLMAMLDLPVAIKAIAKSLQIGGCFVFTIPHPAFWPIYWKYPDEWYEYENEFVIEAPFTISLDKSHDLVTTHVHRPLEMYSKFLSQAGFAILSIHEPMPSPEIESMYPSKWMFPRFFACVSQLISRAPVRHESP